jgi:hypothetical protein
VSKAAAAGEERVCFTVEAGFLMEIARDLAWMDEDRPKAISLLGDLVDPDDPRKGLSTHCIDLILDGEARITGDSNVGVTYVDEADIEWRAQVERRKAYFEHRAEEKARHEREQRDLDMMERQDDETDIRVGLPRRGIQARLDDAAARRKKRWQEVDAALAGETVKPVTERVWTGWKGATVEIATKPIPKPLIDRYAWVVKSIRSGVFGLGGVPIMGDPLKFIALEEERVALHDAILKVAGFKRKGPGEDEFTIAVYAYLRERVGDLGEK